MLQHFGFDYNCMCVCSANEWRDLLLAFGWVGGEAGLATLCEILVRNDLMRWYHLEHVDDPTTWLEAHRLGSQELDFIRMIIEFFLRHRLIGFDPRLTLRLSCPGGHTDPL